MRERGQLVLVAAALVAVALAPIVLAYLQLGYHDDIRATADYEDPTADARLTLDRALATASANVSGEYSWARRDAAISDVRSTVRPRIDRVETASVASGTIHNITYNGTLASDWQTNNCPSGPNRQFGSCTATRGIVVQERLGQTHVLAVGFDLTTTTERGERTVTVLVRPVGGY